MSKHIFWISSYPKSGNTLVRAIISGLFFSKNGKFQLNQLKHSSQFEKRDRLNLIKKINKEDFLNLDQLKILSKYWLILQEKENMKIDTGFGFMKTHSSYVSIFNNWFTNLNNTAGYIYVLRDPRDIYTELKRKGYGYPGYDVETFCNWYKLIMKKIDYTENEKLIFINFEDFALKKDLILKKIFDFLKIEFSNYNDVKFNFKRPENNVQQFKDGLEKIELEYIENKLTNYLFKF